MYYVGVTDTRTSS